MKGSRYDKLIVYAPEMKESTSKALAHNSIPPHRRTLFTLQALKNTLPNVIIEGMRYIAMS